MNTYYPIFVNLQDQQVLIIGGGNVAERKARSLLRCGARVRMISLAFTSGLRQLARTRQVTCEKREFVPSDLAGVRLAICATDNPEINRKAAAEAKRRGILLNVVDAPELCGFIVPSVVQRGDLGIAISTGGSSPALAKKIREEIQEKFGPEYREFLGLLKQLRPRIQREISDKKKRTRIYRELVESNVLSLLQAGQSGKARDEAREILVRHSVAGPDDRRK